MEGAGPGIGLFETGDVPSQGAASQGVSPQRAKGALDNALRKGAKSSADFSEVICASGVLSVLKVGSFGISPSFCHSKTCVIL